MTTGTIAPEDQARLEALVPRDTDPAQYAQRDLGGITDVEMMRTAMSKRINVLLEGPTGTGKSLLGEVVAAYEGLPFLSLPINGGIDPAIIWGNWQVQPDRSLKWVDSNATLIFKYGGLLQFDECNMASPSVNAAFHDCLSGARRVTLLEKGGEVIEASPNLLMVGTMNAGYDGTLTLNQAHSRRFAWQFDFQYDRSVEARLIRSKTLLDLAFEIRAERMRKEIRTDLATPILQMVENTARDVSLSFALDRMVAKFADKERAGVRRSVEMVAPQIAEDLGVSL
jgi:MoxR-like ATPase